MNEPTPMANAIQRAYCKQILEQVKQDHHTLADLREQARCHEALCTSENGPQAALNDPYYLGLLDAITILSKQTGNAANLDEAIKLLYGPEQLVMRMRDRED